MDLREKLSKIQQEMKAPKNLYNSFGKYNYRNAEGILEAFKPFAGKYNVYMVVSDDVVAINDRIYVKSSATLYDCETGASVTATAFAREADDKKGMDVSQITGTASSYARKYALNGLFLLDDTKDADTDEFKEQEQKAKQDLKSEAKRKVAKMNTIEEICKKHGLDAAMIASSNGYDYSKMTESQLDNMILSFKKKFGDD